jgi:hypothetical protein
VTFFSRVLRPATIFVPLAGMAWGLALARALAESFPASPTFDLLPTFLLALAVAALAAMGWRRFLLPCSAAGPLFLAVIYLLWPGVAPRVGWTLLGGSLALALVGQGDKLSRERGGILPYILVGLTLALYLRTLGPTVGQADTFEFQVVAPTWGIAHPTGYPLYILCGKLFSLLPLGSVAWRVNLSSAVFATAAVLCVYHLVRRLTDQPLAALVAALALAFSRVFWSQAIIAEVYALHNLFVAAITFLLLDLLTNSSTNRLPLATSHFSLATCHLPLVTFLLGLSFANHLTTVLLLPALGLTLLFVRPRLRWRGKGADSVWVVAGLFLLGLSLYLYIYFRWPMLHDGVWMSPGEFWRYVTGQQFGGALRLDAWRTDPTRYEIVGRLLREAFGWPGLALAAIGLAWLARKAWRVALVTGGTFLAYAWYALCYYVPDVSVFLLPAHLFLALWIGVGLAAVAGLTWRNRRSVLIVLSLGALLPMSLLWTNLPSVDQSGEREAYTWGQRVLDLPLAPGSAILADSARIAPLYYLQRIEGRRPDLDVLVLADEARYRAALETRLVAGQTVYLARFLPGLEARYHLRALGPLTEVGTAPLLEPPPLDRALGVSFGPIELLGLTGPTPGPDGGSGLTLYWRADAPVDEVYHVRLRLVDVGYSPRSAAEGEGQVWWQDADAGRHAANNYYPTLAWRPGEVVADYHEIPPLPPDPALSRGGLVVQVGWLRPFSDAGLVTEGGETWYALMPFDALTETLPAPEHPLRARFGAELTLVGADLADGVAAGAPVELTLHWHADDAVPGRPALAWIGPQGEQTEVQVLERWGRSRALLQAPPSPGAYRLRLGWVDEDGKPLRARCGWLARPSDACTLATLHVTEAASEALANFDGQMLLREAEMGVSALRPGQSASLTLHWQGLRPLGEDYTVSVQLIGPDGRLYGQTDAWPVQGTLPTSQWSPGQPIADPYDVTLRADAPPGRYQVGVVVYLLATQTRLPLLDGAGQVVGDMALVGGVNVVGE